MSEQFLFRTWPTDDPGDTPSVRECDGCVAEVPLGEFDAGPCSNTEDGKVWFCALCANTVTAPGAYSSDVSCIANIICGVGNHILEQLGAFKGVSTVPLPAPEEE